MNAIFKQLSHYANGFSSLISVLIVGTVGISIVTALMLIGVSSLKTSIFSDEGDRARYMADTCAEEALQKLWRDITYIGGETLNMDGLTCEIVTVTGVGNLNRVVQSRSTVGEATRRVEVDVAAVRPQIILNSWQEVASF